MTLASSLVMLPGCPKRGSSAAEQLAPAPSVEDATGQARCGVKKSSAKPLVVEWPAAERAALESLASRGLVAVRYEGCDMEVLTNCKVEGAYDYIGLTQKREGVRIRDADELYAQLPVGAAALEAKLQRAGQLNVDMVVIGRKEASQHEITEKELSGRCDNATHVVTGLTIGAFSFYTGRSAEVGAGAKVGNIGVGGSTSAQREVLKQDGDEAACGAAGTLDETPPDGCGALLRVEVVPIDRIFGTSRQVTAAGTPTSNGTTPVSTQTGADTQPAWDPQVDKKVRTWRLLTLTGYLGVLAGIGTLTGGLLLRARNKPETEEPGEARQDAIQGVKVGSALLWSGVAASAAFGVLVIIANKRWIENRNKQTSQQQRAGVDAVGPVWTSSGGGLGIRGRF